MTAAQWAALLSIFGSASFVISSILILREDGKTLSRRPEYHEIS